MSTWSGSGWRPACGRSWPGSAGRWSNCRCSPTVRTAPGWTPWQRSCGPPDRGLPDRAAPIRRSGLDTVWPARPVAVPAAARHTATLGYVAGHLTLDVDGILADPGVKIVVCTGAGGVGKTTTAAALALRAAEVHGRRTVVLTIDPARRLAQSLGLTELDNLPRPVKISTDAAPGGELHAMMLDMKRTFDEVVAAHTDARRAEEIFANPFYQAMSSTFAGTQEYMAMEKLGQLRATDEWDLIVVDTPPSRSALDFLDAPARLDRKSTRL